MVHATDRARLCNLLSVTTPRPRSQEQSPLAINGRFLLEAYLVEDAATGKVTVFMPDGRRDEFESDGAGGYLKPYKRFNTLPRSPTISFQLKVS